MMVLASERAFFTGSTGDVVADVMCFVVLFVMFVVLPFLGWLDGREWDRYRAKRESEREAWSWLTEEDCRWFADQGFDEPLRERGGDR